MSVENPEIMIRGSIIELTTLFSKVCFVISSRFLKWSAKQGFFYFVLPLIIFLNIRNHEY